MYNQKYAIYQVFTRLFGNKNTQHVPWGTIEQNGVGKFSDFTDKALSEIRKLGMTHIWYTGVPHHALINDYKHIGISDDHPSVVKGRAGSPYAVKDYYSVNPDLADNPDRSLDEFEALIKRSHDNGLEVIIDIVPNHVARHYKGLNNPQGVGDFGARDDTTLEYHRDNNFYYIPNSDFEVPETDPAFIPLVGEQHPNLNSPFIETPAKWTGNGSRLAKPNFDDWYETVKINYGVRPDGSKDFPELPSDYAQCDYRDHFDFWKSVDVPSSWVKFREIALFWLDKGVDGFRYDMAEMVPVEFWSYLNSSIKMKKNNAFLMAEVYQPALYRDYIHLGKMDYLYDKVDLYDSLKAIMQGKASTAIIPEIQYQMMDIEHHMLHFLDNHDEQRIASPEFVGDPNIAKPAMLVSALLSSSPTMIYFGQEVGEPGAENAGFGQPSRTSIFDYIGVPQHQKWMNHGAFDGGLLDDNEKQLRHFYQKVMNFSLEHSSMTGHYRDLHQSNNLSDTVYAFLRYNNKELTIIAANFNQHTTESIHLKISHDVIQKLKLVDGRYILNEHIEGIAPQVLEVENSVGSFHVELKPLASLTWVLEIH
ncbi:alpha-amylase family protein [Vibrio sp. 10N.261.46.E12]|uniref:alpha-amylase family protein n=1 Tax=unclassified Vibrio TaxID=2614977 RepID=UPI0009757A53|nr:MULTISPECIES: alpha-amylase family protein [unclassified Vibrio]OMO35848.1 alpha-amylase [Vibrio sp. 10N.261.45.E1]PMJ28518.1 alpha-amylase [Vibrio sp. 10N.286.45.B6]PML98557.1 alpha-amylase [Vibrio sp. 10N.261.49.E11]PMM68216.1 alpha-amylase [Vibrio sp. 10N.261.46.F12]PMM83022.1 alpha-amylase [Vibrio sp. 10N.261.46.E8]